jgi:O-antigen chain-terminating methyltransferase
MEPDNSAGAALDAKAAELAAMIAAIRERVRAANPSGSEHGIPLPDLLPLLHARDAAEGKVGAIGSVNPRPPGVLNNLIQSAKRGIARSLNWMVREQVEFNHASVECTEATLNALNEVNRSLAALAGEIAELRDMRTFRDEWVQWRQDWESRLTKAEIQLLRSVGELSKAYEYKTAGLLRDFSAEAARHAQELSGKLAADMKHLRLEHEGMIHRELRTLRQRGVPTAAAAVSAPAPALRMDYAHFAARFRGSDEYVREQQAQYVPLFAGCESVLDIGCGRGEFLDQLRAAGVRCRGIDLDRDAVDFCRSKDHEAECADLFAYLPELADRSLDGVFAAHVIEHLPPERLPELTRLCSEKLRSGGVFVAETPNPQCLASLALHFYNDPTHIRPVPAPLLHFYLEEAGFGTIEVRYLSQAVETIPALAELPEGVRETLFGGLDYAVIARKAA